MDVDYPFKQGTVESVNRILQAEAGSRITENNELCSRYQEQFSASSDTVCSNEA